MRGFREHYSRGLGMAARNNALAFGYSIAASASFAILDRTAHDPSVFHIFLFVIGASLGFSGVNALVTRGYRERVEQEPPVVVALATSLAVLSVSVAAGVAGLIGWVVGGWVAWLTGSLLATLAYLAIAALEMALARGLHEVAGTEDLEQR